MQTKCLKIEIKGVVQGVGFRPFAAKEAFLLSLKGYIKNSGGGVSITVCGDMVALELFLKRVRENAPPLARIDEVNAREIEFLEFDSFSLKESENAPSSILFFPPDLTICKECEKELFDPSNKRYLYPLINCQNCGPRFTVITSLPYDRARTTMSSFAMCDECQKEYNDPLDRRFRAEPVSCPSCGPSFYFANKDGEVLASSKQAKRSDESPMFSKKEGSILSLAADALKNEKIVAVKGVGGFHLLCRADSDSALKALRERKRRARKPLAVMFKNLDELKKECVLSQKEEEIVASKERPITILKKSKNYSLSAQISFDSPFVGAFLPYSGTYAALFSHLDFAVAATSANISNEPIITDEKELFSRLGDAFDYVFYYDRKIIQGCDDSVVRVSGDTLIKLRNSRGYAPLFFKSALNFKEPIFCAGAHQKNAFAFGYENSLAVSQHIGDLSSLEAAEYYENSVKHFSSLWGITCLGAARDANARYASSVFAGSIADNVIDVAHHKAHFLASLFEHNALNSDALGVVWDGVGLGEDGRSWGGEFFLKQNDEIVRESHLPYFWLLGGEKSAKEPKKTAFSLLLSFLGEEEAAEIGRRVGFSNDEIKLLSLAWDKKLNCVQSSSMGRLFDAVAAILGVVGDEIYEGESGLMLEGLYDDKEGGYYDVFICKELDVGALLKNIISESDKSKAASKFINTLAFYVKTVCKNRNLPIFFSGGVFQNAALVSAVKKAAPNEKLFFCETLSPNDSSICVGQAVYSAWRTSRLKTL